MIGNIQLKGSWTDSAALLQCALCPKKLTRLSGVEAGRNRWYCRDCYRIRRSVFVWKRTPEQVEQSRLRVNEQRRAAYKKKEAVCP